MPHGFPGKEMDAPHREGEDASWLPSFSSGESTTSSESSLDFHSSFSSSDSSSSSEEELRQGAKKRRVSTVVSQIIRSLPHRAPDEGARASRVDKRKLHLPRHARWGDLQSQVRMERWRWGVLNRSNVWLSLLDDWAEKTRDEHTWEAQAFRTEMSFPRRVFDYLVEITKKEALVVGTRFRTFVAATTRRRGPPGEPLHYKVAAALKYLTSGASLKDIAKMAGLDKETIRCFLADWLDFLVEREYHRHVYLPSGAELKHVLETYANLGFPGCAFSTDGVHVYWGRCPAAWAWMHTSAEKDGPTRVFNPSVTHNGIVIYVPPSLPGRNNDKTGARYHALLCKMKDKKLWHDIEFELYNAHGAKTKLTGLYSITDGGYHQWRCTQSPAKYAGEIWHRKQSKRMESVRKDVEDLFGKLFARFRVFAQPLRCKKIHQIDNTFRVCCMLHNMLCRYDGLADIGSLPSDWKAAPLALDDLRIVMPSNHVLPEDLISPPPLTDTLATGGGSCTVERDPECGVLQEQLVAHFKVAFERKEILWKKTAGDLGLTFASTLGSWREYEDCEHTGAQDSDDEL